ncbi:hypothetical protein [Streptacidiphilus anmyonensis]|uniref:hypothetical protein n=1 Tax=Streptacidiphilus anmyonensis TaxID=405782 RepID=UPI0005AA7A4E|nr:hypothetical protein [Streptacidiphilus anmyonensis]
MTRAHEPSGMLAPGLEDSWTKYQETVGAEAAREDADAFAAGTYREGWTHIYPPQLYSPGFVDELAYAARTVVGLLQGIPERVFGGDFAAWMEFQGLTAEESDLLTRSLNKRNLHMAGQFARPDFVLTTGGPKVVEVNVSAPLGGMNTVDPYLKQFRSSGYLRQLQEAGYDVSAPEMRSIWGAAFQSLVRPRPTDGLPVVFEAIADRADINSGRQEFEKLVGSFGFGYANGLVQDLDVRADGVYYEGRRVDVVFTMYTWLETRKFVPSEVTVRLMEADAAGLVDFIAPPTSALFDNKANLELLTSDAFAGCFTEAEREFIQRYIPRTFRVTKETAPEAVAHRSRMVLKPGSDYGGRGIVFGERMSDEEWATAIGDAAAGSGFICQERLELWASPGFDGTEYRDYYVCLGPLVFADTYAGALVRRADAASGNLVINVKQGAEAGGLLAGHAAAV